jgi:hypothetical protein
VYTVPITEFLGLLIGRGKTSVVSEGDVIEPELSGDNLANLIVCATSGMVAI